MDALPDMEPGVAGTEPVPVTAREAVGDDPQELFAFTVILPAETPAVVVMELVVELPVHPEGSVQV